MKPIILQALFLLFSFQGFSAYLRNVPIQLKQPDGRVIECLMTGDEFHRRLHDAADYTIVVHPVTGYYVYATTSGDELVATEYIVGRDKPESNPIRKRVDISALDNYRGRIMEKRSGSLLKSAQKVTTSPNKGPVNNLVISVRFADQPAMGPAVSQYNQHFNSTSSLSLKTYYKEVSGGQLDITSHYFPVPQNNQIIEFQDSHPRSYYSPYHAVLNPIGYTPENMVARDNALMTAAIQSVKNQLTGSGVDFDANNDGIIDNIVFVYQGFPDVWGDLLWPMTGFLEGVQISMGGMMAGSFNKQFSATMQPDVISHEFFHSLGAPDLYRYIDTSIEPVGAWDIMGTTGAQHMTAYMKWKYGRWFDEIPVITQPGTYTLSPVSQSPFSAYRIPSPASDTEFFVVEYRKKEGMLESRLPAGYDDGLIIYRINADFTGNAIGPPDEVYVYRPFGTLQQNGYIEEASFSDATKRTSFSDQTNPACLLHSGVSGMIDLSGITINGNTLSFTVKAVNPLFKPGSPVATRTAHGVRLDWTAPASSETHLQGYNVYLAGSSTRLNPTVIADTTYLAPLPGSELFYTYQITAVYQEGESDPVGCTLMNTDDPFLLDSLALVAIYNQCDGPNWARNDNWLTGPLHSWRGVIVGNNRVVGLSFYNDIEHWGEPFGMRGVIPKEIGLLTELQSFNLYQCNLTGSLPSEFWNLTKLQGISISNTNLGGPIPPDIKNLINLDNLNLSFNQFSGNLPEEIGDLIKLVSLVLMDNQFTGTIPASFGNLSSLSNINLMMNILTGEVPTVIYTLPGLENLDLSGNKLSGVIPPEFYQMLKIRNINLNNSGLSGKLTSEIGNLQMLESLELSGVRFEGEIPEELYSLSRLNFLSLVNCGLTGSISPKIGNQTLLRSIQLQGNQMTGSLPKEMGNLKNMTFLWLSGNQFSGDIPKELGNLTKLWAFRADGNQLTGSLPVGFATFPDLNDIELSFNKVENLPDLRSLPNITYLGLVNNKLTFEDLEKNVQIAFKPGCTGIHYVPQQKMGSPETKYALPGKAFVLSVYCGGSANQYRWYKNGLPVSEVQSVPEYTIANVVPGDNGIWICRITSPLVPYLVIDTEPITVMGEDKLFADAGRDTGVLERSVVKLDGRGSNNPGGGSLTYKWTAPEGMTLNAANTAEPTFTAPDVQTPTRFVFILTVTNGAGAAAVDEVMVTVNNDPQFNQAPVADAGGSVTVGSGFQVTLDGSASYDPDDDPLSFHWIAPPGLVFDNIHSMNPTFIAPAIQVDTEFYVRLVVNDGLADSDTAYVKLTVIADMSPVADAGPDQDVYGQAWVTLDGTGSFDPEGGDISYFWIAPDGITLNDPHIPSPEFFTTDTQADTMLVFFLVVTDNKAQSDTAEVHITVRPLSFACPIDANYDSEPKTGTMGPRVGQSITILQSGELERIKLTIWPDGPFQPHLVLREWHSDTYSAAFDGQVISTSSNAILKPSVNNWQEMSTFIFPDRPVLEGGKKYTIEVINAMPYVKIPGGYTGGMAYETLNPDYDRDMRFAVYLCPVENQPPMASVTGNVTVNQGTVVTLDGTASSDPEGETLTFEWEAPNGIELSSSNSATVTFTAPEVEQVTTFRFTLVVGDGSGFSEPVEVAVTVLPVYRVTEDVTICHDELYQGWGTSGTWLRTLKTSTGCDSIVTTNLTVVPELAVELDVRGDTLVASGLWAAWQWYFNGDPIAGATASQYVIPHSGIYKVEVTDPFGCSAETPGIYHVYSLVDVIPNLKQSYKVVPNPNGGRFAFRLSRAVSEPIRLTLVSPNGQTLETRLLHPSQGPAEALFDVRHLSKGIYFLRVQTARHITTEKVVVGEP